MRSHKGLFASIGGVVVIGIVLLIVISQSIHTVPSHSAAQSGGATHATKASPMPTSVPAPPSTTTSEVNAAPLAYYDAVIPQLLVASEIKPSLMWEIATPKSAEVPLYAAMSTKADPVAKLAAGALTRPDSVDSSTANRTVVSVFGSAGGWILIGTPARTAVPHAGAPTPAVSFAYARKSDFTMTSIAKKIVVNIAKSTISIVGTDGTVFSTDVATIGAADTPTPQGYGYVEASYVDPRQGTGNTPINLTNAHSSTLPKYGPDQALTAIHWEAHLAGAHSHGCIRVSIAMANSVAPLIGYPVIFE